MKRLRLGRSSHSRHHHLRFLSETDCEEFCSSTDQSYHRQAKKTCHGRSAYGHPISTKLFNPTWEGVSPFVSSKDHGTGSFSKDSDQGSRENAQGHESDDTMIMEGGTDQDKALNAVVPYRGARQQGHYPDKIELVNGIFGSLGWSQFPDVKDVQGNEIVLFKKPSVHKDPTIEELVQEVAEDDDELRALEMDQSEFGYWEEASHPYSSLQIVELSDDEDEGNLADDEGCYTRPSTASSTQDDDGPLEELGEKVMEMDLD
ncbi:hypothetical protein BG000_006782 [Podila horticola]|nr:hypothetical protein BG000_006782 [Podila horticola]